MFQLSHHSNHKKMKKFKQLWPFETQFVKKLFFDVVSLESRSRLHSSFLLNALFSYQINKNASWVMISYRNWLHDQRYLESFTFNFWLWQANGNSSDSNLEFPRLYQKNSTDPENWILKKSPFASPDTIDKEPHTFLLFFIFTCFVRQSHWKIFSENSLEKIKFVHKLRNFEKIISS